MYCYSAHNIHHQSRKRSVPWLSLADESDHVSAETPLPSDLPLSIDSDEFVRACEKHVLCIECIQHSHNRKTNLPSFPRRSKVGITLCLPNNLRRIDFSIL